MKKYSSLIFLIILSTFPRAVQAVSWVDPFGGANLQIVIGKVIKYALGFVGVAGLLGFLYGGGMWMLAGGDPKAVIKSRNILVSTAIGMAVIIFASVVLTFLTTSVEQVSKSGGAAIPSSPSGAQPTASQPPACPGPVYAQCLYGVNEQDCTCKLDNRCINEIADIAVGNSPCRTDQEWLTRPDGSCYCGIRAGGSPTACYSNADCTVILPCSGLAPKSQCILSSHTCVCSPI